LRVYRNEFANNLQGEEYLDDETLANLDAKYRALSIGLLDPNDVDFRPRSDTLNVQMERQYALIVRVNDEFRNMAQDATYGKTKKRDGVGRFSKFLSSAGKSFRDLFKSKETSNSIFYD